MMSFLDQSDSYGQGVQGASSFVDQNLDADDETISVTTEDQDFQEDQTDFGYSELPSPTRNVEENDEIPDLPSGIQIF